MLIQDKVNVKFKISIFSTHLDNRMCSFKITRTAFSSVRLHSFETKYSLITFQREQNKLFRLVITVDQVKMRQVRNKR